MFRTSSYSDRVILGGKLSALIPVFFKILFNFFLVRFRDQLLLAGIERNQQGQGGVKCNAKTYCSPS